MNNQKDNTVKNTYNNVIPAASGTLMRIWRVPGDRGLPYPVVAWASVNGGPLEALVDVNDTGELTPASELRGNVYQVSLCYPEIDHS